MTQALTNQRLKSSFWHSARLGTGRAYLVARANPTVNFSAAIIKIARRNFAYDGQAEPSRAHYIYGLYCLSTHKAAIRRAVLRGLGREQDDTWALTQLFELALLLAKEGDAEAREALYKQFFNKPATRADWLGATEIITLDGWDGLIYMVRRIGRTLARNPTNWQDDWLINEFQQQYPALDAWAELRQAAGQDADVQRYIQHMEAVLIKRAAHKNADQVFDLEKALSQPHKRYVFWRWLRSVEAPALRPLAERLATEKNRNVRENLLYIFTRHQYPLAYQPILELASQKPGRNNRSTMFAIEALQHLRAPEIREFALQRLATTMQPARYTDILTSNYQAGDALLLTALANRFHDEHIIEQLAVSYTQIYQANSTPECAAPLLVLYGKMTCGIHRNKVVKLLIANNVLPPGVNEELPFDSYVATRLLYQEHATKSALS